MKPASAWRLFFALQLAGISLLLITMHELPQGVASHFSATGVPNGYMSHTGYAIFMFIFISIFPLGLVGVLLGVLRSAGTRINIPNKEYWLNSVRRQNTLIWLRAHMILFGVLLTAFACYVHGLIVVAHQSQPVKLSNAGLLVGASVFLALLLAWGIYPASKFRRIK